MATLLRDPQHRLFLGATAKPMFGRKAPRRALCWIGFGGACGILAYAAARLRIC